MTDDEDVQEEYLGGGDEDEGNGDDDVADPDDDEGGPLHPTHITNPCKCAEDYEGEDAEEGKG